MGKKFGDRPDAVMLRKIDSMHILMPLLMPGRTANEAFISERIDLTNIDAYIAKKNLDAPEYRYNLFQIIVTALLKTITLRPKMNRFISTGILYQRDRISASFVIKREFNDHAEEGMALLYAGGDDNIDTVREEMYRQIKPLKDAANEVKDTSSQAMDVLGMIPRGLLKIVFIGIRFLDRHGWLPEWMIGTDPYRASVLLTNLGSIKLNSGYHHLAEWGTNSFFVIVGEKKIRPFYDEEGNVTMKDSVDIGITVDERIADGYYFSRTMKLFRKLMENPELLEGPLSEEIEY